MRYKDFQRYAHMWYDNTSYMSSIQNTMNDSNIKIIMEAGYITLPYILEEIKAERGHWYVPVAEILGEYPTVKESIRGDIRKLNILYTEFLENILRVEQRILE